MRTSCPKCGTVFAISAQVVGKSVSCRKCGGVFVVQVLPELGDADVMPEVAYATVASPPPVSQPAKPLFRPVQAGGLPGLSVVIILLYLVMVGVFFARLVGFTLGNSDFEQVNWGRMIILGILVMGLYPFLLLTSAVRIGMFISEKVLKVRLPDGGWLGSCAIGLSPLVAVPLLVMSLQTGMIPLGMFRTLVIALIPTAIYVTIHVAMGFPWSRGWAAFAITLPLWLVGLGLWVVAVPATAAAFTSDSSAMASAGPGGLGMPSGSMRGPQTPSGNARSQFAEGFRQGMAVDAQTRRPPAVPGPEFVPAPPVGPPPQVQESIQQAQQEAARRAQEAMDRARTGTAQPRVDRVPTPRPGGVPVGMPREAAEAMRRAQEAAEQARTSVAMSSTPMPGGMPGGPVPDRPDPGFREPTKFSSYATLSDVAGLVPARQVVAAGYGGYVAAAQQDKLGNTIVEIYPPTLTQRTGSFKLAATPETRFAVSNDGQYLLAVTAGAVPSAEVWATATGERIQHCDLGSDGGTPIPLGFTTNNTFTLLWSDRNDYWLQVIETKSGRGRGIKWTLPALGVWGYTCNAANVAISPDGKMIAVVDGKYELRLIDPISGTVRRKMPVPFGDDRNASVTGMAFSADGKQIAILYDQDRMQGASAICVGTVNQVGSKLLPLKFGKNLRQQAGDRSAGAFDKGERRTMDWMADNRTLLLYGQLMIETKNGTVVGRVCELSDTPFGPTMPDGQLQLGGDNFLLSYSKGVVQKEHVYKLLAIDAKAMAEGPPEEDATKTPAP